jgi:ribonuclease HII
MNFKLEKKLKKQGYRIIIGVDEAGRGPLAGPVVACAVTLRDPLLSRFHRDILSLKGRGGVEWDLVRDSKKLSEKQREGLFDFIHENFYVGVGLCDHKTIDRINILQASLLAMRKAMASLVRGISKSQFPISNKIQNLNDKKISACHSRESGNPENQSGLFTGSRIKCGMTNKIIILVDGNKTIPNLKIEQRAIVGGDRKVKSIAAASIIAKVTRDRWMQKWHKKYPQYGFAKHKGYGTKLHLERLKKFGPSSIHRLSFRPVKD